MPDSPASVSARRRVRSAGIVPIEPDEAVAVMLEPGERVLAAQPGAEVTRPAEASSTVLVGDLYVTDRRLIHLAGPALFLPLDAIGEAEVTSEWLLLRVGAGDGVRIRVADPRALRTQIGVARTARRAAVSGGVVGQPSSR